MTVSGALRLFPGTDAVALGVIRVATGNVCATNVPVVAPAPIVSDTGTDIAVENTTSWTGIPPTGAALLSVTVPMELAVPKTELGLNENAVIVGDL